MKKLWPFYLGGRPVEKQSHGQKEKDTMAVQDKYDPSITHCEVSIANGDDIQKAFDLAESKTKQMRQLPHYRRREILMHVVNRIRERFDELSYLVCIEAGKTIKDARGECTRVIDTFRLAAEESTRIYGEYQDLDISERASNCSGIVRRFPVGVVSMISPFNFSINLASHKIAPAIAAGCPFVLKPASKTPLGALLLAEILSEVTQKEEDPNNDQLMLPYGSYSVLPCSRDGADLFSEHPSIRLLSFTGSDKVGWKLKSKVKKARVTLELGGNAACIVDGDLQEKELDSLSDQLVQGSFAQNGQSCISVQRIFVVDSNYSDRLIQMIVEKSKNLKIGHPLEEDTRIGPLISESEAKRCKEWVQEAIDQGGKLLCGGHIHHASIFQATVLTNVPKHCQVVKEEVFGPIVLIEKVKTFREAITLANDSRFGLQCGIFTKNIHHAHFAFEELEYGGVVVGATPTLRIDAQPYGGIKDSGLGREGIRCAIEDMTEMKIMLMKGIGSEVE